MKNFFLALQSQLLTILGDDNLPALKYIRMWNDQATLVQEGKMELFEHPAAFIEFQSANIQQLGEGRQLFDPLIFKIRICDWQMDAGDGTFEQNLTVYDLKDKVYLAIQKFQPGKNDETTPVGSCIRTAEYQDYKHAGVYNYIQEYKTTYVDNLMAEPVNGVDGPETPLPLQIELTTKQKQDAAVPYDATKQYLAVNESYVKSDDVVYVCTHDTPDPAGAFNDIYWTRIEPNIYNYTPEA